MIRPLLALTFAAALLAPVGARAEEVDVEIVLAADGSGSIDDDELKLQRDGYGDAITSREVLDAITSGPAGRIAIAYVEWGGPSSQHVIVDWHVVADRASAEAFASLVRTRPRAAIGYNSISNAIDFSIRMIEGNAHTGGKRVIDVSGDGPNIGGRGIHEARDEAVGKGVTINALAIRRPGSGVAFSAGASGLPLEEYYRLNVIGGPGAFVEIADGTRSFTAAVRSKLVQEIADAGGPGRTVAAGPSEGLVR
jgi:hypothetical protein